MEKVNGGGTTFGGEVAGLLDELLGKVEGDQAGVALVPKSERNSSGAATGLKYRGTFVREETLNQELLGFPKAEKVRGAGVVNDGDRVVEVVANGVRGDFSNRRQGVAGCC